LIGPRRKSNIVKINNMKINKNQDTSDLLKLNSSIPQMQKKIQELKYESGSAFLQGSESKARRDSIKR